MAWVWQFTALRSIHSFRQGAHRHFRGQSQTNARPRLLQKAVGRLKKGRIHRGHHPKSWKYRRQQPERQETEDGNRFKNLKYWPRQQENSNKLEGVWWSDENQWTTCLIAERPKKRSQTYSWNYKWLKERHEGGWLLITSWWDLEAAPRLLARHCNAQNKAWRSRHRNQSNKSCPQELLEISSVWHLWIEGTDGSIDRNWTSASADPQLPNRIWLPLAYWGGQET